MKKNLFLILILWGGVVFGQDKSDSLYVLNEKLSFKIYPDYWKYMNREHAGGTGIGFVYNFVNFPNSEQIKEKWGWGYRSRFGWFPAILDVDIFMTKYEVDNIYQIPLYQSDKYKLVQKPGFRAALSICPLPHMGWLSPYMGKLSEFVVLYVGIGYQLAALDFEKEWHMDSKLNLSAWLWKVGCNIYIGNLPFNAIIEYGQTMNTDKRRNFNSLSIGAQFLITGSTFKGRRISPMSID